MTGAAAFAWINTLFGGSVEPEGDRRGTEKRTREDQAPYLRLMPATLGAEWSPRWPQTKPPIYLGVSLSKMARYGG